MRESTPRSRWQIIPLVALVAALTVVPAASSETFLIEPAGLSPAALEIAVADAGGTLLRDHPEIGFAAAVSEQPGFEARLEAHARIRSVTPDVVIEGEAGPPVGEPVLLEDAGQISGSSPSAAKFFACQWQLTQADVQGAWARGHTGNPGVKVAILDSGIDPFHVDLAGRVDVANSRSLLSPGISPCGSFDEEEIYDLAGHGTLVSSLVTTNGIGTAGVAPDATLVAVKVLHCGGDSSFADTIAGILYAAGLPDVDVINLSLGGYAPRNLPGLPTLTSMLSKAVNFATGRGKLVVIAAGNAGADLDHDGNFIWTPGQSNAGIAVYATDSTGQLASYSNHGVSGTWIGAGGGDFPNSAEPLAGCPIHPFFQSLILGPCSSFVCGGNNFYIFNTGTSFSAPIVSGVAALVDGKVGGAHTAGALKTILSRTAEDAGAPGVDNLYGHGLVDAAAAVEP